MNSKSVSAIAGFVISFLFAGYWRNFAYWHVFCNYWSFFVGFAIDLLTFNYFWNKYLDEYVKNTRDEYKGLEEQWKKISNRVPKLIAKLEGWRKDHNERMNDLKVAMSELESANEEGGERTAHIERVVPKLNKIIKLFRNGKGISFEEDVQPSTFSTR